MTKKSEGNIKAVARNRRARRDYDIEETIEAGIELTGTEVKALRNSNASISEAFAVVEGGEVILHDMHIARYEQGSFDQHEPKRPRRLLLHRREIDHLFGLTQRRGYALIPLKVYFRRGWAKVELGVGRGKRHYDKREEIKRREAERRMRKAVRRERR